MLVLELAYMGELDFIKELQDLKTLLKERNIVIGLVERLEGRIHIVKVILEDECKSEKSLEKITLYISDLLYRIIIKYYREKELFQFLCDTYFFLKQEEILEIEDRIMNTFYKDNRIENEEDIYCENKINKITTKIKECLDEFGSFNINGFIRFRMKELRDDIENVIDKVVEKYMVEKEYKEFIDLLKYFVEIQESKIETVQIFITGEGRYTLTNREGEDIFKDFIKDINEVKLGQGVSIEDVIISGLITNAPKEIIIYDKELCTNREFIDTIEKVFVDKVKFFDLKREIN